MFPVLDERHYARVKEILELYFRDTSQAHQLECDGSYQRVQGSETISSQAELYKEARSFANRYTGESGELRVRQKGH